MTMPFRLFGLESPEVVRHALRLRMFRTRTPYALRHTPSTTPVAVQPCKFDGSPGSRRYSAAENPDGS